MTAEQQEGKNTIVRDEFHFYNGRSKLKRINKFAYNQHVSS